MAEEETQVSRNMDGKMITLKTETPMKIGRRLYVDNEVLLYVNGKNISRFSLENCKDIYGIVPRPGYEIEIGSVYHYADEQKLSTKYFPRDLSSEV